MNVPSSEFRVPGWCRSALLGVVFLGTLNAERGTLVAWADEIYYTSGARMKGLVVEAHTDRLVVSTVDGERVVPRREVDQVFFDDPERNYLYLGDEALEVGDLTAAAALYQKALQLNPQWEAAHDALARLTDRRRKLTAGWAVEDPVAALWTTWGLRLETTASYPAVAALTPLAAAAQAGLRVDDRFIAVWGESMGFRPLPQVAERLLGPVGTPVEVTVERVITVRAREGPATAWPGVELALSSSGVVVQAVRAAAEQAGLRVGDLVVAVNNRPTRYLPLPSVRSELTRARGGARLVVHRQIVIERPSS